MSNFVFLSFTFIGDKKKDVLNAYNVVRKNIYKITHRMPTENDIATAINQFNNLPAMPKDYKKKVLAAFDPEKLTDAPDKELKNQISGALTADSPEVKLLRRLVIINLLEEFGFKDDTRIKLNENNQPAINGKVPEKPTAASLSGELGDAKWAAYVQSLSGVPPITGPLKEPTKGDIMKDAFVGTFKDEFSKKKFWSAISERKNWSDGKKGKILFATSKDTFCMNENGIGVLSSPLESSTSKPSDANLVLGDQEKQTIQGFVNQMKRTLANY